MPPFPANHTWRLAGEDVRPHRIDFVKSAARLDLGVIVANPAWAHRRLLLAAGDRLGQHGLARLRQVLAVDDPTNEIGAAWGIKNCSASCSPPPPATTPGTGCSASTTP
jgi:hypothetical protein